MKKKIKDLTKNECLLICNNYSYCWDCPLLGSSKCVCYDASKDEKEIDEGDLR